MTRFLEIGEFCLKEAYFDVNITLDSSWVRAALPRGSTYAFHPVALGSSLGIPKNLSLYVSEIISN